MSMLKLIVEKNMTAEEQAEMMRLEDEVIQAIDELFFAQEANDKAVDHHQQFESSKELIECEKALHRVASNLLNYQEQVIPVVLSRMVS